MFFLLISRHSRLAIVQGSNSNCGIPRCMDALKPAAGVMYQVFVGNFGRDKTNIYIDILMHMVNVNMTNGLKSIEV